MKHRLPRVVLAATAASVLAFSTGCTSLRMTDSPERAESVSSPDAGVETPSVGRDSSPDGTASFPPEPPLPSNAVSPCPDGRLTINWDAAITTIPPNCKVVSIEATGGAVSGGALDSLSVSGTGVTVSVTSLKDLTISGHRNTVTIESLSGVVKVEGDTNTVVYSSGKPSSVTTGGTGNTVAGA